MPQEIVPRTYRALEWERLKEYLAREATSEPAKEACRRLLPEDCQRRVAVHLDETAEASALIEQASFPTFEKLFDLREVVERLEAKAGLSAFELNQLKSVLVLSRLLRGQLSLLDKALFPCLSKYLPELHALEPLVQKIEAAVDELHEVKEDATEQMRYLRKEVRRIDRQIKGELSKIINSATLAKCLQEPIYTQRGGRYVLPVNASMRQMIPGVVHDSSASGLTVYVEPMTVFALGNELRLKEAEIEHEIARILEALSREAQMHGAEIASSFLALVELDFIFARAHLGKRYKGKRPKISQDGKLELLAAGHPLLILQDPGNNVVANDILLGGEVNTMIVTGPNTGGKTVLLKTAGLLALMMRSGLLLPVAAGSQLPVFENIFADIGDEQSIEQSLSTFSSHMTNIIEIVQKSDAKSLVILDEIGAGTDPEEGAALARAILERLSASGAFTITTTHFGQLKTLAYTQSAFVNASLEFDEDALLPTYKLKIGIPGSSKATAIARRLGLAEDVVGAAERFLSEGDKSLNQTIEQLEAKLKQLAFLEEEAKRASEAARQKEDSAARLLGALAQEEESLRLDFQNQIEAEFKNARQSLRALVAALQKEPSAQKAAHARQEIAALEKNLPHLTAKKVPAQTPDLAPGAQVKILSLNKIGVIDKLPPDLSTNPQAKVSIKAGGMKIQVSPGDLLLFEPVKAKARERQKQRTKLMSDVGLPKFEERAFIRTSVNTLDLRGLRVDEALPNLERFLDECCLNSVSPVMVIHGHGTGAIKSAVRAYLADSPYSRKFRSGEIYEGGDGVTVIDLDV